MADISAAQKTLQGLATMIATACPDLREQVRSLACQFLAQHNLAGYEPEQVYWHRFHDQVSDAKAFSGWAHYQPPAESLTLVQLIMHRFNSNDQDAADELDVSSGFYRAGPDAQRYDSSNDVPLLPSTLLAWLWKIDFKADFLRQVTVFWEDRRNDYRLLAKAHFLGQVLEERQAGALSDDDARWLFDTLTGDTSAPLTLPVLERPHTAPADARVYLLRIGDYSSTDILCAETPTGEHFLWIPGESNPIQKFGSLQALHWWLLMENKDPEPRARFMLHFALDTHLEDKGSGLNAVIDLLYSTWGREDDSMIHHPEHRVQGDAFTELATRAHLRMVADANVLLHSNAEQREKVWIGYLGAFSQVFGPMAAVDWPVSLAVVGAGLASMGLNIDQAVHAPTHGERRAAVIGAIMASIDVLFNGLYVWGAWAGAIAESEAAERELAGAAPNEAALGPAEVENQPVAPLVPVPEPIPVQATELVSNADLPPLQANVILGAYTPMAEGIGEGVYALPDGHTYVSIDDAAYAVRYAAELKAWVVVDPDNPFSFHRSAPLRRLANGEWEVVPRPGLAGGGKFDRLLAWARRRKPVTVVARVTLPYELPASYEEEMAEIMNHPGDRRLKGYMYNEHDSGIATVHRDAQARLTQEAGAFLQDARLPVRPQVPDLAVQASPKQVIRDALAHSKGLVIGEAHWARAAKQLLIERMEQFAREGVDTLYMEHLLTDAHQAELDLFSRSGRMPENLRRYLQILDEGHQTDPEGRYSFAAVVKAAQRNGIRVRALDCAASYKLDTDPFDDAQTVRQQAMNYYAHKVIESEAVPGKWIVLAGNSHSDTYLGVPGLADLEGVTSIRAEDVPAGTPGGFSNDPGIAVARGNGPAVLIKSDLRFRVPVPGELNVLQQGMPPEQKLTRPGQFMIVEEGSGLQLIHRDRNGTLVRTAIERQADRYTLQRPQWAQISGRQFQGLDALLAALRLRGLQRVL